MALMMVTGMTMTILLLTLTTVATAIAPKATWDNPSPMYENRFSTSVTPSREEHSAIKTPAIRA